MLGKSTGLGAVSGIGNRPHSPASGVSNGSSHSDLADGQFHSHIDETVLLATGSADGYCYIYDVMAGVETSSASSSLAPDGLHRRISPALQATNSTGGVFTSSPQLVQKLAGHSDRVYSVNFSPVSSALASCSADGVVRLWELAG